MQNENCLFVKHSTASITIIALYVDDLIIAGIFAEVTQTKDFLKSRYTIKDLGFVNHILECEVFQDPNSKTLYMTQRRYILATLSKQNRTQKNRSKYITNGSLCSTNTSKLPPDELAEMQSVPYRKAIGSSLWLVAGTRADMAFSVQTCAKVCSNLSRKHWKAVLRILRYLHRTINYGLAFRKSLYSITDSKIYKSCSSSSIQVTCCSDSDWGRDPDTRRSVSGYLMFINGCLISWGSKRQQTAALSSMKAKYMALCLATQKAVWLIEILNNLKFLQRSPIIIHEDDKA